MAPTLATKICRAVFEAGILSRAGIGASLVPDLGDNTPVPSTARVTKQLQKMVQNKQLAKTDASYVLADAAVAELLPDEQTLYQDRLIAARDQREIAAKEKAQGKQREEKRVAIALKKAISKKDRPTIKLGLLAGL